jgi:hypothetical protein
VLAKWREKHPEMAEELARMQAAPLLRHRRDVFEALAASASDPDPKSHPDRKLALEMMGDYRPKQELTGADGGDVIIRVVYADKRADSNTADAAS